MRQSRDKLASVMGRRVSAFRRVSHSFGTQLGMCLFISGVLGMVLCACGCGTKLPQKSSKEYAEAVSAFYIGLGALQVWDDVHAESKLSELTTLVPGEPAGW